MSELTPLRDSSMTDGQGGYGWSGVPRQREIAKAKARMEHVIEGTVTLSYDEMQTLLTKLVQRA